MLFFSREKLWRILFFSHLIFHHVCPVLCIPLSLLRESSVHLPVGQSAPWRNQCKLDNEGHAGVPDGHQPTCSKPERGLHLQDSPHAEPRWGDKWKVSKTHFEMEIKGHSQLQVCTPKSCRTKACMLVTALLRVALPDLVLKDSRCCSALLHSLCFLSSAVSFLL